MDSGVQLKYGHIRGGKVSTPVEMASSQELRQQSGRFVYMDAGQAKVNADGSGQIFGSIEAGGSQSPSAGDKYNCIIDPSAVYRIPIDSGTYNKDMIGDTCDLAVSSNIQGAQLDASVEDTLIIVGGDEDNNNYVDVMINPSKFGTGSGADA